VYAGEFYYLPLLCLLCASVVSRARAVAPNVNHRVIVHSRYVPLRGERWLVALICSVAAIRILFFCAVFPFFNNVDEQSHFDLIWKYSMNRSVLETDRVDPNVLRIVYLFGSPEYLLRPIDFPGGSLGPPHFLQLADIRDQAIGKIVMMSKHKNIEEYSPPLYYFLAGRWTAIGRTMGLRDGGLLYWARFLNVPLYVLIVWISYRLSRLIPYKDPRMVFGIPLLAAFMPQSVFYSLNSDILTPLPSGIALLLMIRGLLDLQFDWRHYAALGLCLSAAILTKLSNLPLFFMTAVFIALKAGPDGESVLSRKRIVNACAFCICLLPIAAWSLRNFLSTGDWTGTSRKVQLLGWTYKPVSDLFSHPIFTFSGINYFFNKILSSFWLGEFTWGLKPLVVNHMDYCCSITTLFFLFAACITAMRMTGRPAERDIIVISLAGIFSALVYMALLSMLYNFGHSFYPSAEKPFFVSGRLILCVMFPILLCITWTIDRWATRSPKTPNRTGIAVIIVLCVFLAINDLVIVQKPLASVYNFFHIPLGAIG